MACEFGLNFGLELVFLVTCRFGLKLILRGGLGKILILCGLATYLSKDL
jgi:hypothetical protein